MMVVGLSYRLVPMIVPAEMPNRRAMAVSRDYRDCRVKGSSSDGDRF